MPLLLRNYPAESIHVNDIAGSCLTQKMKIVLQLDEDQGTTHLKMGYLAVPVNALLPDFLPLEIPNLVSVQSRKRQRIHNKACTMP